MRAKKREGRPTSLKVGTASVSTAIKSKTILPVAGDVAPDIGVRCMRCQHPLTAERSVWIGLGPECRKVVLKRILAAS